LWACRSLRIGCAGARRAGCGSHRIAAFLVRGSARLPRLCRSHRVIHSG
jgi:hypothetical protein